MTKETAKAIANEAINVAMNIDCYLAVTALSEWHNISLVALDDIEKVTCLMSELSDLTFKIIHSDDNEKMHVTCDLRYTN